MLLIASIERAAGHGAALGIVVVLAAVIYGLARVVGRSRARGADRGREG